MTRPSSAPVPAPVPPLDRRALLGAGAAAAALSCAAAGGPSSTRARPQEAAVGRTPRPGRAVMVGSRNALEGMKRFYARLGDGDDPLAVAIEVVKLPEADPNDHTVGLGGLPNEDGVVQLDAACMHGPRHRSGAVAGIENILHPSEVARLVLERTDHCLLVGKGAYEFARAHGHPHTELLTEEARRIWLEWKESLSAEDDWLPAQSPAKTGAAERAGAPPVLARGAEARFERPWGTVHCSALSARGEIACTTTTSGLAFKIPGRVGDSAIVGAGLYCDQEAGSAGATGRGEAAVLANGSFAAVELMRQGASPLDAGLEVLRRVARQTERQAERQPELIGPDGRPSFNLSFYVLGLDGTWAGVTFKAGSGDQQFAVADPDGGPRLVDLVPLY